MELRTRCTVHRPKVLHFSTWQEVLPADIPFIVTASPGISLTVRVEGEESTPSIAGHLSKRMNRHEKELEAACTRYAREQGWLSIKLENTGHTGIPDRLFLKDGRAVFVEFKTPGSGRLSLFQSHWLKRLEREQFTAVVIRNEEEFKEMLK